jgi:hypothetical protein
MLVFIPILMLFLAPLVIVVLTRLGIRSGYLWFLALGTAVVAWVLILVSGTQIPMRILLMQWTPAALFSTTPTLLLDDISWTYAAVMASFPLAVLLSDSIRAADIDPDAWATSLAMTGLGLLAVLAANPLTLMLAWVVMDLSETFMLLQRVATSEHRERVVVAFSVRLLGILLVLIANMVAVSRATLLIFESIPAGVSGIMLLAVGIRLGVLPPHQPFFQEPPLRRGLGTIVRLMPVASSLVVLTRLAQVGVPPSWQPILLTAAVFGLLYAAFAWVQAEDELDGRPYWILGMATLALIAAIFRLPEASLAWSLALILPGGVLFLTSYRTRLVTVLGLLGLIGFSLFPFTPTWRAGMLYSQVGIPLSILFLLAHALLMVGYIRHLFNMPQKSDDIEPWMTIVFPVGLAVLLGTHWGVALSRGALQNPDTQILSLIWWAGALAFAIALVFVFARNREIALPPRLTSGVRVLLSLEWIYRMFWWLYRSLGRLFSSISSILEGEGGIMWAMLIIILLIAFLSQQGAGG